MKMNRKLAALSNWDRMGVPKRIFVRDIERWKSALLVSQSAILDQKSSTCGQRKKKC